MARSEIPMVINLRQNKNDESTAYGKYFVCTLCHMGTKVQRIFGLYAYSTVKHFNEWKC